MNIKLEQSDAAGQYPSPPTHRVIAVVELLAEHASASMTLAEICRELGITRSTGHAILHTLCMHHWVLRDPVSGKYSIGHGLPAIRLPAAPAALREPLHALSTAIDMPVCLSEVRAGSIVVVDSTAPPSMRPPITAGVRLPFVAPFGREFVAWAPAKVQQDWMAAVGPVNDVFRARMAEVMKAIRHRGYGIERLTDQLIRVFTALLALDDGNAPDEVAARLAGAVADLTIIDMLPGELPTDTPSALATISAPIRDAHGAVVMSVSAQPYRELTQAAVDRIASRVVEFAQTATALVSE
jgi:DNA-binding IclR family transcriptional regulator